jgi:hypothetical protein
VREDTRCTGTKYPRYVGATAQEPECDDPDCPVHGRPANKKGERVSPGSALKGIVGAPRRRNWWMRLKEGEKIQPREGMRFRARRR